MPATPCWKNCARAFRSRSPRAGACSSPMITGRSRRCWRCTCRNSIWISCLSHRNIRAIISAGACLLLPASNCRTRFGSAACARMKRHGAGMSARGLCSKSKRSFSTLWLMEETGQPYERVLTDLSKGEHKSPEYLAINPMGKVPALRDGDATLAEAAAICAYVAERYPEAKLAPPLGDPLRAKYLYWLFYAPGCLEPAMVQVATKIQINPVSAGWGDAQ